MDLTSIFDLPFWVLVIGFGLIFCAFAFVLLKIADRRMNIITCNQCGWEGTIDGISTCPICGHYDWEEYNGK